MELLSLLATQSEPAKLDNVAHHLPPPSASDLPDRHIYHPQRTPSITRINTRDFTMDSMSPTSGPRAFPGSNPGSVSPRQPVAPKNVAFELMFPDQYRARLPMRVKIYPHDTTDSIITTVKNFYGLYATPNSTMGVSFEDDTGTTLIARYENFRDNMNVFVRVTEEPASSSGPFNAHPYHPPPLGAQAFYGNENYQLHQPQQLGHPLTRPDSRTSRQRSASPNPARGRRSASTSTAGKKGRSRSSKNRVAGQVYGDGQSDGVNGYSSGDGASASGKVKEQIGNTEISVENIVEGGRRKRAKFDSSELPLFAPPQMPAATSNPSVSPARRIDHHHRPSLPFIPQGQHPFSNPRPLQSPQTYNNGFGQPSMYATPIDRRSRGSMGYPGGILPTPDPTVGSCMSEEDKDVALQLMRLGDMSNISHGRTSASTLDDTFSGRADAASSTGATSDVDSESEDELPAARRQKLNTTGDSRKVFQTTPCHFGPLQNSNSVSGDEADSEDAPHGMPKPKAPRPKTTKPRSQSITKPKIPKPKASRPAGIAKAKKVVNTVIGPMSPSSLPASRKQSIASITNPSILPGEEETPDLSTKPRCQRCRKSKKGCDRQRPCGRCRDAGLSADQCISEDEGNGRKGRYGRHMGVPIKKEDVLNHQPALLPAAPISAAPVPLAAVMPAPLPSIAMDKSKKRKR